MPYILSIDQGTTGSRVFLFDSNGRIVSSAYQEFKQYYPKPGWVEHDPEEIYKGIILLISKALRQGGIHSTDIKAIGITNQRETAVVWDRTSGRPYYRAIVWQDRRTQDQCRLPSLSKHRRYIHEASGLTLDPYFSATKVAWLLDHVPQLRKKANQGDVCFGTIDTWLMYRLTAKAVHMTDMTNASRTMLFNIKTKQWDDQLLKIFNVPRAMLPAVYPSGHVFGHTLGVKGLPDGIPICAVMGDQQAALYGQGCFSAGSIKNTYGTGCFLVLNTGSRLVRSHHGLLTTLAADEEGRAVYALEGSVFIAGALVQWLRDGLGIISSSGQTENMIHNVDDTGGVYIVPAFVGLGAPYWQPEARGLICGLTRGSSKAHLVRAALEAIAYQTKDVFDVMKKDTGLNIRAMAVDGGACRNNFLMQFQSDLLNVQIQRPQNPDTTASGAAHLAGVISGVYKISALNAMRPKDRNFKSSMPRNKVAGLYRGWQAAINRTLMDV